MKLISLTQELFAQVDDEDFEWLSQFKWHAHKQRTGNFYAMHGRISMHNKIMQTKGIDHIDGNGLNNQKSNLRKATQSQNLANVSAKRNKVSKYKGVCFKKQTNKWVAQIRFNYKRIHLGYYDSEIEAARAYDTKAKELFGEFAKTNFDI